MATSVDTSRTEQILGPDADSLLRHECKTIPKSALLLPGPDYVDRAYAGRHSHGVDCTPCAGE